jgi:predicted branched-subunit amino acid permease
MVSAAGFGFVYGLTARTVGHFSPLEAVAMSLMAFGGAAQFAAIGYVASGLAWPAIGLLTFLLNARHALYSAALAPWFRGRSLGERAIVTTLIPWNVATFAGVTIGDAIVDPNRFGIDVIFPAAMAGLMVGLLASRREVVAALGGAAIGVGVSLIVSPTIGIIAGGVLGPFVGLVVPLNAGGPPVTAEATLPKLEDVTP